jgi:type VI secretion system protein ImpF
MDQISVWERLTRLEATSQPALLRRCIAHDLEVLLNTRTAIPAHTLADFPYCRDSIANFGLADFAHLCLASSMDREEISTRLAAAIARHEPRLRDVQVQLADAPDHINRLCFVIHGRLPASARDSIRFDITLQPSSLRYTIR